MKGKLKEALNELDIFCITGNGVDAEIQKQADVPHADLVIACASTDELNMLSCLIARRLGAKHTIARVRNPIYYRQIGLLKEDLHLSMAVNPELTAANEIARVLTVPPGQQGGDIYEGAGGTDRVPVCGMRASLSACPWQKSTGGFRSRSWCVR